MLDCADKLEEGWGWNMRGMGSPEGRFEKSGDERGKFGVKARDLCLSCYERERALVATDTFAGSWVANENKRTRGIGRHRCSCRVSDFGIFCKVQYANFLYWGKRRVAWGCRRVVVPF